jgi:hypothetical protein
VAGVLFDIGDVRIPQRAGARRKREGERESCNTASHEIHKKSSTFHSRGRARIVNVRGMRRCQRLPVAHSGDTARPTEGNPKDVPQKGPEKR